VASEAAQHEENTMLPKFKDLLKGSANRLSGQTDVLEAVAAASALVAYADGDASDDEIGATITAIKANEVLNTAFSGAQIEAAINRMLDRAAGGRVGRQGLLKECADIAGSENAELALLAALDVAEADGNIDDDETKALEKVADKLGLKLSTYL
jgi:tellurite resistance protein TerB